MHHSRHYDIVLLGATGFTGQIIAKYLDEKAISEGIKWAIAGRDEAKLAVLKANLTISNPDILVFDIKNSSSIENVITQSVVVMNTVGPFNWYGRDVVKSCVEHQTHYIDITGEPSFVAEMFIHYDVKAKANQTAIVNCCGFDSIPADFAAWITAKKLPISEPKTLQTYIRTNASFSGGTLTTAVHALYLESQKKSIKHKVKRHPDAPKMIIKLHKSSDMGAWAIPMPVVDPHIVKRSVASMPQDYGEAVSYGQYFVRSSFAKVLKTILSIASIALLVRFKSTRERLFKKFPSGSGPSQMKRDQSKFEVVCIGKTKTVTARTVFSGGDPGYTETAKMMSESAFTLLDKVKNKSLTFGVLTPVQAFGQGLLDRLRNEGIHIE